MSNQLDTLLIEGEREKMFATLQSFLDVARTAPSDPQYWSCAERKWQVRWLWPVTGADSKCYSLSIDDAGTVNITSNTLFVAKRQALIVTTLVPGQPLGLGPLELARTIEIVAQTLDAAARLPADPIRPDLLGTDPNPWLVALAMLASRETPSLVMDEIRVELGSPWAPIDLYDVDMVPIEVSQEPLADIAATAPLAVSVEEVTSANYYEVMINHLLGIPGVTMPSLSTPTDILRAVQTAVRAGAMKP